MKDFTIDLSDIGTLHILSQGLYAKLADIYKEDTDGLSARDRAIRKVKIEENYLALAKINVHFEQATLKDYKHTPIETKLAKAKIATAKVEVEIAAANLDVALEEHKESRRVIVIPHA